DPNPIPLLVLVTTTFVQPLGKNFSPCLISTASGLLQPRKFAPLLNHLAECCRSSYESEQWPSIQEVSTRFLQDSTTTTKLLKPIRTRTMATPKIRTLLNNNDGTPTEAMMAMASGMTTLEDTMKATATTSRTITRTRVSTARSTIQTSLVMTTISFI